MGARLASGLMNRKLIPTTPSRIRLKMTRETKKRRWRAIRTSSKWQTGPRIMIRSLEGVRSSVLRIKTGPRPANGPVRFPRGAIGVMAAVGSGSMDIETQRTSSRNRIKRSEIAS
jgi:hypothetical protein